MFNFVTAARNIINTLDGDIVDEIMIRFPYPTFVTNPQTC